MGEDAKFVIEDAERALDIVFLINQIGLKKYDKDWRKIHKKIGISASQKVKLVNIDYHYREKTQPKDKRRKPIPMIRSASIIYKDYRYYISLNTNGTDQTKLYRITSYYGYGDRDKIERKVI